MVSLCSGGRYLPPNAYGRGTTHLPLIYWDAADVFCMLSVPDGAIFKEFEGTAIQICKIASFCGSSVNWVSFLEVVARKTLKLVAACGGKDSFENEAFCNCS